MIDLLREWAIAHGARPKGGSPNAPSDGAPAGELESLPWGVTDELPTGVCEIIATLGSVELEYAAIHRSAAVIDASHRAIIAITGEDRHEFLDRLVTNKVTGKAGEVVEAFLLDRSGRILAEVVIGTGQDTTWLAVDVAQREVVSMLLESFIFTEDVVVAQADDEMHTIEVHGTAAAASLSDAIAKKPILLADRELVSIEIGGDEITVWRLDTVGVPGLHITGPADHLRGIVESMISDTQARPIGWFAYNMARVESLNPMMNIDYGTRSIPNETGVLTTHVSGSKGCFPGQEIVTRIASRGKPRQVVVGLKVHGDGLPVAGSQIYADESGSIGPPVGIVTSSTISPLRGATPIALATIKTASTESGTIVRLTAEGEEITATVMPLAASTSGEAEVASP